jgi:hypothetical protein
VGFTLFTQRSGFIPSLLKKSLFLVAALSFEGVSRRPFLHRGDFVEDKWDEVIQETIVMLQKQAQMELLISRAVREKLMCS